MAALIKRQVNRAEEETRNLLASEAFPDAGENMKEAYRVYREEFARRPREESSDQDEHLADFLTLCQTASFLARGTDQ